MTNNTITIEQITATKTYGSLNTIQQSFCIKRKNRQSLTDALIVFRNTNVIPGCVFGYNLGIVRDLILGESAKIEQPKTLELPNLTHIIRGEGNKIENLEWVKPKTA